MLLTLSGGLAFSSRIISTDVPLLFFWTLALLSYVKLLQGGGWKWGALLGVSFGLGMLSKYAMIYFAFGVAGAALFDRDARALLRRFALWIAVPIAAAVVLPNVLWNARNSFITLTHVGHNITGDGVAFNPLLGLEFLGSQFGVFGPVTFSVLLLMLVRINGPKITRADRLMLCFAVPALALVTVTAFTTRAFANWAAVAFISANIAVAAVLVREAAWRWIAVSIAIGGVVQVALLIGDANARNLSLPFLRQPDVYNRTMGWRSLGDETAVLARRTGAVTVVAEGRDDVASLIYYLRATGWTVLAWPTGPVPGHHFELTRRLTAAAGEPVLLISRCSAVDLAGSYRSVEPLGPFQTRSGPHATRGYFAYLLSGATGQIVPRFAC
jgi:4-amino-4-deoxy-L-arabinose transferase-like glycosyltransferase